jgi:integrase
MEKIPEKYQIAIELLLDTGMRTGELLALQKKDFVDGCIYVYKAISGKKLRLCRKAGGTVTYRLSLYIWQNKLPSVEARHIVILSGLP